MLIFLGKKTLLETFWYDELEMESPGILKPTTLSTRSLDRSLSHSGHNSYKPRGIAVVYLSPKMLLLKQND